MGNASKEERRENVITVLNKARAMELTAITQYMNQHYGLDDMDYGDLAAKMKLIAIDEMRHAEQFAERIKELGGEPTTEPDKKTIKGQEVGVIFPYDVNEEDTAIDAYNQFLLTCHENGDNVTADLFAKIIEEEQVHLNYFANIAGHIENLGNSFLSKMAGTSSSTGLGPSGFVNAGE